MDPIYGNVNGEAEVVVSGDWMLPEDTDPEHAHYRVGYVATVYRDGFWNGFATPHMTREVVERLMADQNALGDDSATLAWEGDTLVYAYDGEQDRVSPDPGGLYAVGFGWVWQIVDVTECDEVIGDAPVEVTVRLMMPRSVIDKWGEKDVQASIEARMDEFYLGPDGEECFVTGPIEVAVAQ